MIDRQYDEITFECDGCGDALETHEEAWENAHTTFRLNGWKSEKVGKDWTHLCQRCQ